jgi:hypothetical protein
MLFLLKNDPATYQYNLMHPNKHVQSALPGNARTCWHICAKESGKPEHTVSSTYSTIVFWVCGSVTKVSRVVTMSCIPGQRKSAG